MADLSVMGFLNEETQQETEYNLKDTQARSDISTINGKIPSAASSSNKLVDTTTMNDAIGQAVSAAYKSAGNKTVAELTSSLLVAANRGKVYNMTDAGTTTADFVEGAGHPIRVGDDIGICEPTTGTFKFNILSGFIAVDTNPTQGSANPVSSGGVYSEFAGIKDGQSIDSFGDVETALAGKVDKVTGKGLSKNDYTDADKAIVGGVNDKFAGSVELLEDTTGWLGGNLLDNIANNESTADISYVVNSDKSVTANGNPVQTRSLTLNSFTFKAGVSYVVSGCPKNLSSDVWVGVYNSTTGEWEYTDKGNGVVVQYDADTERLVRIRCGANSGQLTNVIFYPMVMTEAEYNLSPSYRPYHESVEEYAFPRSEQAVLGARNWFSTNNIASGASLVTITNKGKSINVKNTTAGAYQMVKFDMPCEKNTDYTFTVDIDYVSGASEIIISDTAESNALARINSDVTADRSWSASFNTGNNTSIRFRMYCTRATSETGEINFNNTLLKLASDTDTSWSAPAMTNKELTEKVTSKVLSSTDDLDNIKEAGVYYWLSSAPSNAPESATFAVLEVFYIGGNLLQRVINSSGNPNMYIRRYAGSPIEWKNWFKFTGTELT